MIENPGRTPGLSKPLLGTGSLPGGKFDVASASRNRSRHFQLAASTKDIGTARRSGPGSNVRAAKSGERDHHFIGGNDRIRVIRDIDI